MIGTPHEDEFISQSVMAVAITLRSDGSPHASMVSYARDGDDLFFTTTLDRLKGRNLTRDSRLALTIIDWDSPLDYVTIEGEAVIQQTDQDRWNEAIITADLAHGLPFTREEIEGMLRQHGRVIVHIIPKRVTSALGLGSPSRRQAR